MGLLYRALWTDEAEPDRREMVDLARECFSRWALDEPTASGLADGEIEAGRGAISVRSVDSDGVYGIEGTVREVDRFSTWTVSMKVLAEVSAVYVWVDVGMEADDPTQRVKVGRPRLVADLLALSRKPCLGVSSVVHDVVDIQAPQVPLLVELLRSADRTLPFIVFSSPGGSEPSGVDRPRQTSSRAGGIATVITLDESATHAFNQALGELAVWGGAVRTYAPAPLDTAADGWRHRYIPAGRLQAAGSASVDRLVYAVAQLSTRRHVPQPFRALRFAGIDVIGAAQADAAKEELQLEVDIAIEERGEVEQELARANGHLDRLRRELESRGMADLYWERSQPSGGPDEPPDSVQDVTEAVTAAGTFLIQWVRIASSAPRDLEGIDSAPNAYSLGNTTWRGFRALAAYAQAKRAGFSGNFWSWCERGDPLAWPATKKKLAMTESETVRNGRHADSRMFELDIKVAGVKTKYMEAHLKISEGGGDLAPRVYFYDDTDGTTKKIHVGFVGPHYLVPNTKG